MPELAPLHAIDAATFDRMLRYALVTGADQLQLRPGHRPTVDGMGGPRALRFRQLSVDDTAAIAGHLLARSGVSERLRESEADAGQALYAYAEIPGEALFEARFRQAAAGIACTVDVIRPISRAQVAAELETVEL